VLFFGPLITLIYKDQPPLIFYISAGIVSLNFILLIFYKEPDSEINRERGRFVFGKILKTLFISIIVFVTLFAVFLIIWVIEIPFFFLKYGDKLALRYSKSVLDLPIGESNKKVFENITGIFSIPNL
jgi:hypothetical protein